jgi:aryl-alcohol dehydrogenase-like predicted oxidoreductase
VAIIDALARARAAGLRIGLTVSGPTQADTISRALEVRRDGGRVFDTVQATWNLLERGAETALGAAHDEGMGVIVKEALANGRLTPRGVADAPADVALLAQEAERLDVAVDVLALASALAQPWADVVLSGAATVWQLESNMRVATFELPVATADRLRGVAVNSIDYWRARSALPWN